MTKAGSKDDLGWFAERMERRAKHLRRSLDLMVPAAFIAIADQVFIHSPVWSSQSVINWTASIGRSSKSRFVEVEGLETPGQEGNMSTIIPNFAAAEMARFAAAGEAKDIANTYPNLQRPKRGSKVNKSIWLTNVISYTPDLWTGAWPSNMGMTLAHTLDAGVRATKNYKVWRF